MWLSPRLLISFNRIIQIMVEHYAEIDLTAWFCGVTILISGVLFLVFIKALSGWWWTRHEKFYRDMYNRALKNKTPKQ